MKDRWIESIVLDRYRSGVFDRVEDVLLKERPLTIQVNGDAFVTVMCTPGDEMELAAGLLFTEGIIDSKSDIAVMRFCPEEQNDVVEIVCAENRREIASERIEVSRGVSRSSCGICGRKLIEQVKAFIGRIDSDFRIEADRLIELQSSLGDSQRLFKKTGAAHSAGLFDCDGAMLSFAEDAGRHNALDKSIGRLVLKPPPGRPDIAIVSSRASFEMIQKIARAEIPIACFGSAVTDIAVALADDVGLTLIGFMRHSGMNIYTHAQRIIST